MKPIAIINCDTQTLTLPGIDIPAARAELTAAKDRRKREIYAETKTL